MMYFCCDSRRRDEVRSAVAKLGDAALNGIDYVEVLDSDAPESAPGEPSLRQRILLVHFLHDAHLAPLTAQNVRVEGGERTLNLRVERIGRHAGGPDSVREVRLNTYGDYSTYTLRLVKDALHSEPPEGFDSALASVAFSFKVECPTEFDCATLPICPPEPVSEPEIDYLAKDFASFRRLMLDRMAMLMPQLRDSSAADLGITLVEALAYVGDHLSYQQDAIGTEAYFGTARQRISVRRHARLVDYTMHEGCNARTWVHVEVEQARQNGEGQQAADGSAEPIRLPAAAKVFAGLDQLPRRIDPKDAPAKRSLLEDAVTFETVHDALLFAAHNQLRFYSWSDQCCCLLRGATRATLVDDADPAKRVRLCAGDVLVFVERLGPTTGELADADPTHRHAVRLRRVSPSAERVLVAGKETNRIAGPLTVDKLTGQAIVEIEWDADDALPFPLCLSSTTTADHGARYNDAVSVALGNIVLADHGLSVEPELLCAVAQPRARMAALPRFSPRLARGPLTHAVPYAPRAAASATLSGQPADALPAVTLKSGVGVDALEWSAQRDLLASNPGAPEFVVELDNDAVAQLRFGGDRKRPQVGMSFSASYRVGNGAAGNLGADAITHIVSGESALVGVSNPLPARGGVEPESVAEVRQSAPYAFRRQERAVTEQDYADITEREPDVQRAAATFRWTGSWHTAFVTVDRQGGPTVDAGFETKVRRRLERVRLLGHDIEVDSPRFVPLEIEMHVCVKRDYFRSHVLATLREVFSSGLLRDGRRAVFHPDNFTFGQPVFLSPLYAAAQRVDGVDSVHVTTFQRMGFPDPKPLIDNRLVLGRLEIARLDSDPNFPERGVFRLNMGGGK